MNRGSGDSLSYHQYLSFMFLQRSFQVLLVFGAQALHAAPDGRSDNLNMQLVLQQPKTFIGCLVALNDPSPFQSEHIAAHTFSEFSSWSATGAQFEMFQDSASEGFDRAASIRAS